MSKFLSEEERLNFLDYLKKHNLQDNSMLATLLHVSETTISTNLTRFPRKDNPAKARKVPRIWKDVIELTIENGRLKERLEKMKEIVEE